MAKKCPYFSCCQKNFIILKNQEIIWIEIKEKWVYFLLKTTKENTKQTTITKSTCLSVLGLFYGKELMERNFEHNFSNHPKEIVVYVRDKAK